MSCNLYLNLVEDRHTRLCAPFDLSLAIRERRRSDRPRVGRRRSPGIGRHSHAIRGKREREVRLLLHLLRNQLKLGMMGLRLLRRDLLRLLLLLLLDLM